MGIAGWPMTATAAPARKVPVAASKPSTLRKNSDLVASADSGSAAMVGGGLRLLGADRVVTGFVVVGSSIGNFAVVQNFFVITASSSRGEL